jgi:UDP-glucose 4-epimerase
VRRARGMQVGSRMNNTNNARPRAVLVTGGAGYIGSHTAFALVQEGFKVVVIDDFSQERVAHLPFVEEVIQGDFADPIILSRVFTAYHIEAVFHFAAFIEVGESVKRPREFYDNNVSKTAVLLNAMLDHQVLHFIFSSSCAVYGEPIYVPMDEKHQTAPVSPYGRTKLAVEFMLQDYAYAYGLRYASLRYFNASGAQYDLGLGEQHTPETHLIPRLLNALIAREPVQIFGDDYPTSDGTCVRDYIHVQDLATAHVLSFRRLCEQQKNLVINIGTGHGYTVREVVKAAEKICGLPAKIRVMPARSGDAPMLVANTNYMYAQLKWKPQHSDLTSIIASAYAWQQVRYNKTMNDQSQRREHTQE